MSDTAECDGRREAGDGAADDEKVDGEEVGIALSDLVELVA